MDYSYADLNYVYYAFYNKTIFPDFSCYLLTNEECNLKIKNYIEKSLNIKNDVDSEFLSFLKELSLDVSIIKEQKIYNENEKINETNSYIINIGNYGIINVFYDDKENTKNFNSLAENYDFPDIENFAKLSEDSFIDLYFVEYKNNIWYINNDIEGTKYNIELLEQKRDLYSFAKGICE
jgi:hypothetical protein